MVHRVTYPAGGYVGGMLPPCQPCARISVTAESHHGKDHIYHSIIFRQRKMDVHDPAHAARPADIRRLGPQRSTCFDDGRAVLRDTSRPELRCLGEELASVVSSRPVHDSGADQPEPEIQRVTEHIDQYDPGYQLRDFQTGSKSRRAGICRPALLLSQYARASCRSCSMIIARCSEHSAGYSYAFAKEPAIERQRKASSGQETKVTNFNHTQYNRRQNYGRLYPILRLFP